MELIALSGYARSGKDEAAKVLIEEFGFVRVAFADKLREVLYALNPIVGLEWDYDSRIPELMRLREVIDYHGWDGYKITQYVDEIRPLCQRLGTEAGRQTLWDSIWIDAAFANLSEDANIVVTDCRFPNEAQAIKDRGGEVWRIMREGVGPATGMDGKVHSSETSLDDWKFDAWLNNNFKSVEDYRTYVANYYRKRGRVSIG